MKNPDSSANLFRGAWTPAKLRKLLTETPRRPLLPPLGSDVWQKRSAHPAIQKLIDPFLKKAKAEWKKPMPLLTDALYAEFQLNGSRLAFEEVYFLRRRMLARAAISLLLCAPDDPWRSKFTESMIVKLTSILEEVSWALPAHVLKRSGKDPGMIDLFAAETANTMAEMLDLFSSILPAPLQKRIRQRLHRDIFEAYRNRHQEFHWSHGGNNWNAVCHQGVIGSALSQVEDVSLLADLLMLAREGLPHFLKGFGADGGTSEGPGYWEYGFGWFTGLNEQLETRTSGRLSLFAGDPKIREIARFGPRATLRGGNVVNFSDGGPSHVLRPAILSYLGERLNEPECLQLARINYQAVSESGLSLEGQRVDLLYLTRMLLHYPEKLEPAEERAPRDHFMPDLAVLIAHGTDERGHFWDFAAKAGHNNEHHNHNDCGSYILNIDGERFACEIGAPEYVKEFFGPKRYEFLAARSLGHPVPLINGEEQYEGGEAASVVLRKKLGRAEVEFKLDLAPCYPAKAGCRKSVRSFLFEKKPGRLTVEDKITLSRPGLVESAFISIHPITLSPEGATIEAGKLKLALRPLPGTQFARAEMHPYRDRNGKKARIYRLALVPAASDKTFHLGLRAELVS